jgi:glycosyltransferase involved in cell wall biosynthesis
MMQKVNIALLVEDHNIDSIDFSNPSLGNPGVGATEYLIVSLAYFLRRDDRFEITLFHTGDNIYPKELNAIRLSDRNSIFDELAIKNFSQLIFCNQEKSFLEKIDYHNIPSLLWAHNFIFGSSLKFLAQAKNIKIVFSSVNQRNRYIDHQVYKKSVTIKNIITTPKVLLDKTANKNIVFMGNLVDYKGFHIVAKVWKRVIKKHADAHLHVIGSGQLYDSKLKLGEYELAENRYEKKFMKYLIDNNNKVLNSVTFYGRLGSEKFDVLRKCSIGIFNPKLKDEVFPTTIIEMNSVGIFVIGGKTFGVNEIIEDNINGFILNRKSKLLNVITKTLDQFEKFDLDFKNGVISRLNSEVVKITDDWYKLISNEFFQDSPKVDFSLRLMRLRVLNQKISGKLLIKLPAIVTMESQIRNFYWKLKKMIKYII